MVQAHQTQDISVRPQTLEIGARGFFAYLGHFGVFRFLLTWSFLLLLIAQSERSAQVIPIIPRWDYGFNSAYVTVLLLLFGLCTLIESLALFEAVSRAPREPNLKRLSYLLVRTSIRNVPHLLLALAFIAESFWSLLYLLMSFVSYCYAFYFGRLSDKAPYRLVFNAYSLPSLKRGLTWCGCLLAWSMITQCLYFEPPQNPDGMKLGNVKGNMRDFQTLVETCALNWNGIYPASLEALEQDAKLGPDVYWKEIINPYSYASGRSSAYELATSFKRRMPLTAPPYKEILGLRLRIGPEPYEPSKGTAKGLVLFKPMGPKSYQIFGTDQTGQFITDNKAPLILTNS